MLPNNVLVIDTFRNEALVETWKELLTLLIDTLPNNALVDNWRVLLMFVILAFVDDTLREEAVIIETLPN